MANAMPIERLQAVDNVEKEIARSVFKQGITKMNYIVKLFQLIAFQSTIKDTSSYGIEQR